MRIIILLFCIIMIVSGPLSAQEPDSTSARTALEQKEKKPPISDRVYFGGSIGFSFGDYSRVSIAPLVGYRLNRMFSVGVKAAYEYIKDKRYTETVTFHNYGGSFFTRFRPHRQVYLHGEFAYFSYEYRTVIRTSERDWVPFLYLGGGYIQPLSKRSSMVVEVLFDVLQDDKSPYEDWYPFVSVGIVVGI
jgi:hypothetical protein